MNFKIGLKLYSTNIDMLDEAAKLFSQGRFDYIELYAIPGSYPSTRRHWQSLEVPFVVHAAHFMHGINFAIQSQSKQNQTHFGTAQRFADLLNSPFIIVHAGNGGPIEESIRQIGVLQEPRIAIENKPKIGLNGAVCVGWSPDQFAQFQQADLLNQMVLDFGHAACSAASAGQELFGWLEDFLAYSPCLFHLVDCLLGTETDQHLNLGQGTLPIKRLLNCVGNGQPLTLETPRKSGSGLADFITDVDYLDRLRTP